MRTTLSMTLFAAIIFLFGCSPSTEEIANSAEQSMQAKLDRDDSLSRFKLTVKNVQVIELGKNQYQGIAEVESVDGTVHPVKISIVADGKNLQWEAGAGAFSFLLAEALKQDREEQNQQERQQQIQQDDQFWAVQVASLSSQEKVDRILKSLAGHPTYVTSENGMNRVFVGPIRGRAAADILRADLTNKLGLNGFVVRAKE